MKLRDAIAIFLALLSASFLASSMIRHEIIEILNDGGLMSRGEFWGCDFWNADLSLSSHEWVDDVFFGNITVPGDNWGNVKIQQGVHSHTGYRLGSLKEELLFRSGYEADDGVVFLRIRLQRGDVKYFDRVNKSLSEDRVCNIGVDMWFNVDDTDYFGGSPQLIVDVLFHSERCGDDFGVDVVSAGEYHHDNSPYDSNKHSAFFVGSMNKTGEWYEFAVDIGHFVKLAFDRWGFRNGVLKNFEVYLEGIAVSSWFLVDYVLLTLDPKINSLYMIRLNMPPAFLIAAFSTTMVVVAARYRSSTRSLASDYQTKHKL